MFLRTGMLAAAVLTSTGCLTLYQGTTQAVKVDSSPAGARVLLNGRPVGTTPMQVIVSRNSPEPVIRIEKDGFGSDVQRLQRRVNWWIAVDVALEAFIVPATGFAILRHLATNKLVIVRILCYSQVPWKTY